MKKMMMLVLALGAFNAFAADPYYVSTIDWEMKTPDDYTTLVCDDTYYFGVEIEIPGVVKYPEYSIYFKDCGADWKITKKKVIDRDGKPYTSIRFKGGSNCEINVHGKDKAGKEKIFVMGISDAC